MNGVILILAALLLVSCASAQDEAHVYLAIDDVQVEWTRASEQPWISAELVNPMDEALCVSIHQLPWGETAAQIAIFHDSEGELLAYSSGYPYDNRNLRVAIPSGEAVSILYSVVDDYTFLAGGRYTGQFRLAGIPCTLLDTPLGDLVESSFTPGIERVAGTVLLYSEVFEFQAPIGE